MEGKDQKSSNNVLSLWTDGIDPELLRSIREQARSKGLKFEAYLNLLLRKAAELASQEEEEKILDQTGDEPNKDK